MKFEVTGITHYGAKEKRIIESSTKHEIELNKIKHGFSQIINIKQKGN